MRHRVFELRKTSKAKESVLPASVLFTDFGSRRVLRFLGLNPDKDVVLLADRHRRCRSTVDGHVQRHNGCDAYPSRHDFLAQIKWGKEVQVLGGLKDTAYRATGGDIMAGRRYLKDKPDLTRRFSWPSPKAFTCLARTKISP